MELTLQIEPVVVKDENGDQVLEAPLLDLYYFCANVLTSVRGKPNEEQYAAVAAALNERYELGDKFTWGAACLLVIKVEQAINELKKNGELREVKEAHKDSLSQASPSPSFT